MPEDGLKGTSTAQGDAVLIQRQQDTATASCSANQNSGRCERDSSANSSLPIALGIVIPLVGAVIVFIILHRRHINKLKREEINDPHKSLDFGMDPTTSPSSKKGKDRGGPEMSISSEKEHRPGRGMSMEMGIGHPYLLPPELHNSRESLHSLSRSIHGTDDRYARGTTFIPGDGSSVQPYAASPRRFPDNSSIDTGSSRGGHSAKDNMKQGLLKNAGAMPHSGLPNGETSSPHNDRSVTEASELATPTIPRKNLPPATVGGALQPPAMAQDRDSYIDRDGGDMRRSNNYLAGFINYRASSLGTDQHTQEPHKDPPLPHQSEKRKTPPSVTNKQPSTQPVGTGSATATAPQATRDDPQLDSDSDYGDAFNVTPPSPDRKQNTPTSNAGKLSVTPTPVSKRNTPANEYHAADNEYHTPAGEHHAMANEHHTTPNEYHVTANEYHTQTNEYHTANEYNAPASEHHQPANEYHATPNEYYKPANEYRTPADEYHTPANEYHATANEYHTPANEYRNANEYNAPASEHNEYYATANEYHTTSSEYGTPANERGIPVIEYDKPANEHGAPGNGYGTLVNGDGTPANGHGAGSLEAPNFDTRRLSLSIRPLPREDPNDSPEQRANRIRSFYKEYFDDSKPGPAPPNANGEYHEDYDPEYLEYHQGDAAAVFDTETGDFVVAKAPYAEPVTRRAMTPPPRAPPRFQSRGPPHRGQQSMSGFMPPGPRAHSSASGRFMPGGRPMGPSKPLPPPAPLRVLPTPHLLKEDAFVLPIEFAPPPTYKDRTVGRPESPLGGYRPYSPSVPARTPLASPFEELAIMPSPHALRKSSTFTGLDFALPPRFKNSDTGSDAGSIRSNRTGMSSHQLHSIRAGAYRVSRLPTNAVGTRDDLTASLRPTWGMRPNS
ncbi:MAG: hypothetical protein M1839_008792 [Geoglossum umbratile]|nr:MAG: hypothetical protein M1839_008792 [Geoglossum umbratile]